VSAILLKKNHDKNEDFYPIKNSFMQNAKFFDDDVINQNTYDYKCRISYNNGKYRDVGLTTVKFVSKINQNDVKLKINNLKYDEISNNVTFDIDLQSQNSDQNLLKKILEQQGLLSYFNNEINLDREKLEDLIAFRIKRINLKSGVVDTFSVTNKKNFSDLESSANDNFEKLQPGIYYKYVVDALIRTPASTIKNLKLTGSFNNKTYYFDSNKFLHPLALNYGIIGSNDAINNRYAETFMEFGEIGLTTNSEIKIPSMAENLQLLNFKVENIDSDHEAISWDINGNINEIEHFLIIRNCSGIKSIVARATPITNSIYLILKIENIVKKEIRNYSVFMVKK
jgi:hypothetical protein